MHLAYSVRTPTIALFGASPWMVWTPPVPHLYLILPEEPCSKCYENRFRNAECLLPRHQCMLSVRPERVIERLKAVLGVARRVLLFSRRRPSHFCGRRRSPSGGD
jgi:ADP-heptose:LPS heptosyltransferase